MQVWSLDIFRVLGSYKAIRIIDNCRQYTSMNCEGRYTRARHSFSWNFCSPFHPFSPYETDSWTLRCHTKSFSWATPKSLQFELAVLSKPGQAAQRGEVQVVGTFTQALYKSGKKWVTSIEHLLENTGKTQQALCISSHIPLYWLVNTGLPICGWYYSRSISNWVVILWYYQCAIYIYITQTTSVFIVHRLPSKNWDYIDSVCVISNILGQELKAICVFPVWFSECTGPKHLWKKTRGPKKHLWGTVQNLKQPNAWKPSWRRPWSFSHAPLRCFGSTLGGK